MTPSATIKDIMGRAALALVGAKSRCERCGHWTYMLSWPEHRGHGYRFSCFSCLWEGPDGLIVRQST